jgi:hypothetical protein
MEKKTPADYKVLSDEYGRFTADLQQKGHYKGGNSLQPTSTATRTVASGMVMPSRKASPFCPALSPARRPDRMPSRPRSRRCTLVPHRLPRRTGARSRRSTARSSACARPPLSRWTAPSPSRCATGPSLPLVEELERSSALAGYHVLHAAKADLLRRLGRQADAAASFREALALAGNEPERRFLSRRLDAAERAAGSAPLASP